MRSLLIRRNITLIYVVAKYIPVQLEFLELLLHVLCFTRDNFEITYLVFYWSVMTGST